MNKVKPLKISTIFLQGVVILSGFAVLAFMLWEPHLEGRNVNATLVDIYFRDPFLAYVYLGSIPFFVALFQLFRILGFAGSNTAFSHSTLRALRIIKYCAFITIGFVIGAEFLIMLNESDDRAGGVVMGMFVTFGCLVAAALATLLEQLLLKVSDSD